jgi:hypothetical protein
MKTCNKCKLEKELSEFVKDNNKKDGLKTQCKSCTKQWREKNKDKLKNYNKEWGENNKEKIKLYYEANKDKKREYAKKYGKLYYQKNKHKKSKYVREKRKNDSLFRLRSVMGSMISKSLKRNGFTKKVKSFEFLCCSFEEFKLHLESQFESWMSWDNYGLYNGELNYGWDVDHIIPLSSVKTEEEILKLNHYTNLRPLCSKINRYIKRDKLDVLYFHEI